MLPLDSPRWSQLNPTGIEKRMRSLLRGKRSLLRGKTTLADLHDDLLPKQQRYTATYAAVPYLLQYARASGLQECINSLIFLANIRDGEGDSHSCPVDILQWYDEAMSSAGELAVETYTSGGASESSAFELLAAMASLCGCEGNADQLVRFANDECCIACPECETELFVWPMGVDFGFFTGIVGNKDFARVIIDPVKSNIPRPLTNEEEQSLSFEWLYHASRDAGYVGIADMLRYLYGRRLCPDCGEPV